MEVRREDPKFFLRCGPGKTKAGRPGWTETINVGGDEDNPLLLEADVVTSEGPPAEELARTLLMLEELGLVQRTPDHGQAVFDSAAGPSSLSENDDDADEVDSVSDRGHLPHKEESAPPKYSPLPDLPEKFQ